MAKTVWKQICPHFLKQGDLIPYPLTRLILSVALNHASLIIKPIRGNSGYTKKLLYLD